MNIFKLNVAILCSLLLFLFAAIDMVAGGDYADGKLGQAMILDGSSKAVKIPHYAGLKSDKAITVSAGIKTELFGDNYISAFLLPQPNMLLKLVAFNWGRKGGFRDNPRSLRRFDAQDPAAFMKDISTISGQALLPPKWVMGFQLSHRTVKDESLMLEVIDTFREKLSLEPASTQTATLHRKTESAVLLLDAPQIAGSPSWQFRHQTYLAARSERVDWRKLG